MTCEFLSGNPGNSQWQLRTTETQGSRATTGIETKTSINAGLPLGRGRRRLDFFKNVIYVRHIVSMGIALQVFMKLGDFRAAIAFFVIDLRQQQVQVCLVMFFGVRNSTQGAGFSGGEIVEFKISQSIVVIGVACIDGMKLKQGIR